MKGGGAWTRAVGGRDWFRDLYGGLNLQYLDYELRERKPFKNDSQALA